MKTLELLKLLQLRIKQEVYNGFLFKLVKKRVLTYSI